MKTVLQQLIDLMSEQPFTFGNAINLVILNELIEKEKEQIIDAVKFGQNNHTVSIPEDEMIAKNYFNDKYEVVEEFNQNK